MWLAASSCSGRTVVRATWRSSSTTKKTEVPPQLTCPRRAILFERSREPRGLDPILESHAVVQGGSRVVRLVLATTDPVRCGPRRRENGRALVADLHPGRANEPRC